MVKPAVFWRSGSRKASFLPTSLCCAAINFQTAPYSPAKWVYHLFFHTIPRSVISPWMPGPFKERGISVAEQKVITRGQGAGSASGESRPRKVVSPSSWLSSCNKGVYICICIIYIYIYISAFTLWESSIISIEKARCWVGVGYISVNLWFLMDI